MFPNFQYHKPCSGKHLFGKTWPSCLACHSSFWSYDFSGWSLKGFVGFFLFQMSQEIEESFVPSNINTNNRSGIVLGIGDITSSTTVTVPSSSSSSSNKLYERHMYEGVWCIVGERRRRIRDRSLEDGCQFDSTLRNHPSKRTGPSFEPW